LTENYFDQAVDFIVENHARGAVFHNACKTLHNEDGIERVRKSYRKAFEERISLICIKVGSEEVVGLNALYLKSRFDAPPAPSDDPNFLKLQELSQYVEDAFRVADHYRVDRFVFAAGLAVDRKLRGRGIATEILKARAGILKAIGLSITTAIFSTVGAQKAAASAGYDENYSIKYEELEKLFPLDFSFVHGGYCKVLSLKV
jgi:GNAT superfamily N-acetyltransferase